MNQIERVFFLGLLVLQIYSVGLSQNQAVKDMLFRESLCDVESNLSTLVGREIEVEAIYKVGFEMGWLESKTKCDLRKNNSRFRYIFDPMFEENTEKKVLKKFSEATKWPPKKKGRIRQISGLFKIRVETYKGKTPEDRTFEYDITILKLEKIH